VTLAVHQHAAEFPDDLRRISTQIRDTRNRRWAGRNSWRCPAEDDRRARPTSTSPQETTRR
jgi:hypothetical protein